MTLAMNQSLTPTRLDAPFSPSNYPDKRSVVAAYKRMVQMVLDTAEDRAALHKALKEFHRTFLVEDLMENLRELLNHPRRRQLYLAIRPLIPSRQRPEYNSLIPHIPSFDKKVIHLKQPGSRSHGFSIRGGKEFDCGIFVTSVLASSKAEQCGLKPGDELLRVNGLTLSEATHEEVVNLIKLKRTLTLTLREVGMLPEQKSNKIIWKTVAEDKTRKSSGSRLASQGPMLKSTKRIQLTLDGNNLLGASIKSSNDPECGVFIVDVVPNSVGHNAGLRVGDELIEVNGSTLINKEHSEAISLLKSSESLMLTIRVEEPASGFTASSAPGHYDPLSNPPEDFELNPHDFDIDAELIPTDLNQSSTGFVLKPKLDIHGQAAEKGAELRKQREAQVRHETNRLSLLDMEISRSRNTPMLASPAAVGYGPTMAMPTLMGMMPEMPRMEDGGKPDTSLISAPSFSPDGKLPQFHLHGASVEGTPRQSVALDMSNFSGDVPASIANIFQSPGNKEQSQELMQPPPVPQPPPTAPKPKRGSVERKNATEEETEKPQKPSRSISGADLASYQFPVDEEEEESPDDEDQHTRHVPSLDRQPSTSAMKKSPSDHSVKGVKGGKPKKTPAFRENVEIINVHEQAMASSSNDTFGEVHPSNMEFSEEVLQGRQVAFHTIPKDGPIKIAIRGGTDTPLGGQIIISRILEGGAADRYGKLSVGDQILVCDGISLIEVTHDEAAQALKRAMDMESASIDLVVAVSLDAWQEEEDGESSTPTTVWPPQGDTLCDQHPTTPKRQFDFAKSAHRSHSGFTLRGKDKDIASTAHAFLPRVPPE